MDSVNASVLPSGRIMTNSVAELLSQIEDQALRNKPKSKVELKNYKLENVKMLREIQSKNRLKQDPKSGPLKAVWRSEKYANVPSKLFTVSQTKSSSPNTVQSVKKSDSSPVIRDDSAIDLTYDKNSNTDISNPDRLIANTESISVNGIKLATPNVPVKARCFSGSDVRSRSESTNFLRTNALSAKSAGRKLSPAVKSVEDLRRKQQDELEQYKRGTVPKYLKQRQEQWKVEDEKKRVEAAKEEGIPVGHSLVPENERKQTLANLIQKERGLYQQLCTLPVNLATRKLRDKKQDLEQELTKVEEGIRIFSLSKVFVKNDV